MTYNGCVQLPDLTLFILDTETTGFMPRVHRIMEFAAVTVTNGKVTNEYEKLFAIDDEIPPHVRVLTRIREDDLKGKPTLAETREEILALIPENAVIVGQNIPFDLSMLKGEGIDLTERPWIDTSMLASIVFPELASYSLGYMSEVLHLTHEPKHRALGDVHATLELLEQCMKRLMTLAAEDMDIINGLAARGPEGYRRFFAACTPKGTKAKPPAWLAMPKPAPVKAQDAGVSRVGESGAQTELTEESLDPASLQEIIGSLGSRKSERFTVAVKNLDATLKRIRIPDDMVVLRPSDHHIDREAVKRLLAQESFTADELTLAIKLYLYDPSHRTDLPLHGDEHAIWRGKLALTEETMKRMETGRITLMSHDHLLSAAEPPREGRTIIEDASMLEDTATKAYGRLCDIAALRAGAEGNETLTKFCDLLQLWIEKTRRGNDVHYISVADLSTPEAKGLREHLSETMEVCTVPRGRQALADLERILDASNLEGRIVWIETMLGGKQSVQSVPLDIAKTLEERLFSASPVSLLIPAKSAHLLGAILSEERRSHVVEFPEAELSLLPMRFEHDWSRDAWINEAEGKSILLASSRRVIEDIFVRHTEALEERGVTLICQGMNGGMGRMQAEFSAAPAPAILVMTPWMYEAIDLPAGTVDALIIESLPFDHPSHAVRKKRSDLFRNSFEDYSLPRVMLRLFRLLRTFARHRTGEGSIVIADERIRSKGYGMRVREYLENFARTEEGKKTEEKVTEKHSVEEHAPPKPKKRTPKPKKKTDAKAGGNDTQQSLF